ncbi:hypothetical protein T310_4654 [Rasamsonia emersonii CBS 393.64]|uniref:Uncharacterized protein n=1 Tax=Rasamsonia emersonii (strain ATCC 16479 / CBS 393.64 / IMI 116815) TaxID=1408163 RepID=A0A0F4YTD6_RASE3|nr:hypothetical protein T310_4654 [Rasamsonia emersonii CBS 393.64]KKA21350.1 hypothetical protein T310_4654 [Rasamsonia emersonii CBS 393.64]
MIYELPTEFQFRRKGALNNGPRNSQVLLQKKWGKCTLDLMMISQKVFITSSHVYFLFPLSPWVLLWCTLAQTARPQAGFTWILFGVRLTKSGPVSSIGRAWDF